MTKTKQAALELLDKILKEDSLISQEDLQSLIEHKESCTQKLLPFLTSEITQIEEGSFFHREKFHKTLLLLGAFEEKKAFDSLLKLHDYPEALEDDTGYFMVLYWADILIATASDQWLPLVETVKNPEAYQELKDACIDALVGLVAKQKLEREIVVDFLQSFYREVLDGQTYDIDLLSTALEASTALWPGESMEEIKEIFGLDLVDEEMISLAEITYNFEMGQEECLKELHDIWIAPSLFGEFLVKKDPEPAVETWERRLFEIGEDKERSLSEFDELDFEEEIEFFENLENHIPPLLPCPEIEHLSSKEQSSYESLPRLLLEDPETALEVSAELVATHSDTPAFFYYFHEALLNLDAKTEAMELVKKWTDLFPQDLLAKVEYGHYFLRRGEAEKASALFADTWSLPKLYPEKKTFHEIECLRFFNFLGCYYLQKGEIQKAKEQVQILDATNPNSFEYYHLKRKISLSFRDDFL